jgi:hypothetical protein
MSGVSSPLALVALLASTVVLAQEPKRLGNPVLIPPGGTASAPDSTPPASTPPAATPGSEQPKRLGRPVLVPPSPPRPPSSPAPQQAPRGR